MDELEQVGRPVQYVKGEILIHPSDPGDDVFLLKVGIIRAYTISASGAKNIQLMYGHGEVFPVSHLVHKRLQNVYYEALTDCKVVRMQTKALVPYLQSNAAAGYAMLTTVAKEFIVYKARVDILEYQYARERVAYQLLLLGKRFGKQEDGDELVMQHFPQDVLAESCNVSRESVNRELKRFERLGYIVREPGQLRILSTVEMRKQIAPLDTPLFIDDL